MQVTWHLLGMFFWEIYEIFRTAFTRNTRKCQLLQLVVTGRCFNQSIFFRKYPFDFSHLCFDIQWHVFLGIKCITDVQELNIWIIRQIVMFKVLLLKLKQKNMSSFIQNISVFTKDFKNHKTYFTPLINGKIIFKSFK